jgi:hypothetical protein
LRDGAASIPFGLRGLFSEFRRIVIQDGSSFALKDEALAYLAFKGYLTHELAC